MSTDDFFKQLDLNITEIETNEQGKDERLKQHEIQVRNFVQEVIPELENYKEKLEQRGIRTEFTFSKSHFQFKLYYNDGGHHGFMLIKNHGNGSHKIFSTFTNDSGKNYTGEDTVFEKHQEWTWMGFKKYVENSINSFITYSTQRGGYKETTKHHQ